MGAGGNQLGQAFRDSVPDQGFPVKFDLFNELRGNTGLLLTTSTAPKLVLSSDYLFAQWDGNSSVQAYVKHLIGNEASYKASKLGNASTNPNTYNVPLLNFQVHLRVRMGAAVGPDNPVITVTAKLRSSKGAIKATFTPTSPGGTRDATTLLLTPDGTTLTDGTCVGIGNSTNPDVRTWNFYETYGTGPVYAAPDDYIDIKIVPGAHTTDALELHGATMTLQSNPNYTDFNNRPS